MADFLTAVAKTIEYEGGLVDDPDDPGGLTNFGIALKEHPELTASDIRMMTRTRAIGIYREKYWNDLYGQIEEQVVATSLFDWGVTSYPPTAVKGLQAILPVEKDGAFGLKTLYAVNNAANLRVNLTVARLRFYMNLGRPEFLHSWLFRSIDVLVG